MSNKEKNTKEEPYLLQDEKSLDELKNVDTTIIEPEDQEKKLVKMTMKVKK